MANNGQQRPPFARATQPLPLSTIQVYFQVVRQRARREPSGGISAADAGAASMWQWISLNTEEHLAPKLPSAGSGPSGPLNKSLIVSRRAAGP